MVAKLLRIGAIRRGLTELGQLSRSTILVISLVLIVALGIVEYYWGAELSFLALYLLPIALASWFVSLPTGIAITLLSGVATTLAQSQGTINALTNSVEIIPSVWNATGLIGVGAVMADLLHRVKVADAIGQELSRIDVTTGAINRRFFLELLEAEFHRAERYSFSLTLAYINLNNLNQVTEKLGHQASEELLYHFVEQLSQTLRANDVVARLGNNEFALLLPQTNETQAQKAFERLYPQIQESLETEPLALEYTIGVTTFLDMPETIEELIETTDQFSKRMKDVSKNRLAYQVIEQPINL